MKNSTKSNEQIKLFAKITKEDIIYKRLIAMLLSLILMLGVSGVNASAAIPEGNNKALRLSSSGVELYCFGVLGAVECNPVERDNQIQEEDGEYDPIPINQNRDRFESSTGINIDSIGLNPLDIIDSVGKFRVEYVEQSCKEIDTSTVYMQLPSKNFDGAPYYNEGSFMLVLRHFMILLQIIASKLRFISHFRVGSLNKEKPEGSDYLIELC